MSRSAAPEAIVLGKIFTAESAVLYIRSDADDEIGADALRFLTDHATNFAGGSLVELQALADRVCVWEEA
jgi:hypothetical protein